MSPKTLVVACLFLLITAWAGEATPTAVPTDSATEIPSLTVGETQAEAQAEIAISECQRIEEPGSYYLTTGLDAAPILVSVEPELAPPYTGDSSLEQTCIEIAASNVTLDCRGHTLTGAGEASNDTAGIYIAGSADAPLSDVSVESCAITGHQFGLYAGHLNGGNIFNNQARRNNGIGFYLTGLSDVSVVANTAEGNDPDGMLLIGNTNVGLADNAAFYNRMRGITFEGCQGCVASRNESHSHGVLGFGIYGSRDMALEENVAYNNRYHGFAILHEAGSATFRGNESYANERTGFFLQESQDNYYIDNVSHDNALDGLAVFNGSQPNTFEDNTLRDNGGYGVFSDAPIDSATFAGNTFSGNALGETGSSDPEAIDWCSYTGFGPEGPCDPIFEGGPNLKDPQTSGVVIRDARIVGDPIYYPSFGDLWMSTWADDGRLFLTWGDGTGFGDGYPIGYPAYETPDPVTVTFCEKDTYLPEEEGYFPCWLWCNIFPCGATHSHATAPLADAGVLAFEGSVPEFVDVSIASIDVPSGEPFFLQDEPSDPLDFSGRNDKPSSLLFHDGRLYLAGHSPAGQPVLGYLAYSDDYGQTWTEVPDSPWGETSNFRVLMFINMGQDYALNQDGYVYALGVGTEASWTARTVYLTRVPEDAIADYGAYEYFIGLDGDEPRWSPDEAEATPLDNLHTTGQASAMYHAGTGRYLMLTTDAGPPEGPQNSGALFEAPQPWGPWTRAAVLCFAPECNDGSYNPAWTDGKYIAGLIPKDAGPNHVYFTIAGGDQHYQLQIGRLELDTGTCSTPSTPAIPRQPPRADKISFGPLDGLGEATVTGAPGAVLPSAHVLLVNLDTAHQDHVCSAADGSFSAKILAPPGSAIMVKHGPDHRLGKHRDDPWHNVDQGARGSLSIFPSTTIYRPHEHAAGLDAIPFATAGATDVSEEPSSIGAGWSMIGTVSPASDLQAGDTVHVEATIRLYSRAIVGASDVSSITLQIDEVTPWLMLYDGAGNPLPHVNLAGSNRLTPTGFPILDSNRPDVWTRVQWQPVNWQFAGGHVAEGTLAMDMFLDADMPPGIYRPILNLRFTGVPSDTVWPAALLSWMAGMPSFKNDSSGAALPPLEVKAPAGGDPEAGHTTRRLVWYLQMDNASLGTRGSGAVEDRGIFQPASFVVTQGAPYVLPPVDAYSGEPAAYRLEPYLPMISYGRDAAPGPPLIPFILPGGQLCVTVQEPDGHREELGCEPFAQSVSGNKTTALGEGLNAGVIEVAEYYGLTTANDRFVVSFTKPGPHVIEVQGWVEDVWGNRYEGGGTYDVWVAYPFDIDPGLLPGTPLAVGDAVNPTVQLQPRLPAHVNLTIRHFPDSDPGRVQVYIAEGFANRFGYFAPPDPPIVLNEPGEYRLDLTADYVDPATGELTMGAATWGGVVMTPPENAQLVAHGRRGSDNHSAIPGQWFVFCDPDLQPPLVKNSTPHLLNPYLNGDILWSYDTFLHKNPECLGDALLMNASIQDTVGAVATAITERYNRIASPVALPGNFEQRAQAGELPLFSSTISGRPVSLAPEEADQVAYAYLSSQRSGVRVRESVAEDRQGSGYWRLDSMYDNQPSVGVEGDLPNDFKYQFVGVVYRDLESGLSEYLGQASGWVHLPYSDITGSRVMPPFSGPGNGGWPTIGGPLMTLQGKAIHMFILPTGVRPGAVLQVGDRFDFAGHLMPTLDSRVEVEVTAPSGQTHFVSGRANQVGYFHGAEDSFVLDEAGRWMASVQVWHDGQIGSGEQVNCDPAAPFDPQRPCPAGDVLGSANGRYAFYVVPAASPRLAVTTPAPGRLTFEQGVTPITISGSIPTGVSNAVVDYTISMPGFILAEGQAQITGGVFSLTFDPAALHNDFPNLDLTGRHGRLPGLADTFSFGLLLTGRQGGEKVYLATTLTIQGDQVYVESAEDVVIFHDVYLPVVLAND